jgi:exonuclease III
MSIKLISLNIEFNKHYDKVFSFFETNNPDVICLQEILEEDFEFIQKKIGYKGVFKFYGYQSHKTEYYKDVEGKRYGVAIFAKEIISNGYEYYWGKEENFSIPPEDFIKNDENMRSYVFLWVIVQELNGNKYTVVTTHFPVTREGESTPHQLEILLPFFEKLDTLGDVIVCGDFNAPRGNETFKRIAQKYKDSIPEEYRTSIDQNLHRVKGIMFMVDGLFLSKNYEARNVRLQDGVSDHMAIVATIFKK